MFRSSKPQAGRSSQRNTKNGRISARSTCVTRRIRDRFVQKLAHEILPGRQDLLGRDVSARRHQRAEEGEYLGALFGFEAEEPVRRELPFAAVESDCLFQRSGAA